MKVVEGLMSGVPGYERIFSPQSSLYARLFLGLPRFPNFANRVCKIELVSPYRPLLDKVKNVPTRIFYIQKAIENGWTRNVMIHQIETSLHERQGNALTNFEQTLPKPQKRYWEKEEKMKG